MPPALPAPATRDLAWVRMAFVIIAALLAAACAGGAAGGAAVDGAAVGSIADTSLAAPAVVDTTVTPVAATTAPEARMVGGDDCLHGTWRADAASIQAFMDTLGTALRFEVDPTSMWNLTFERDQVTGSNAVTLSASINGSLVSVSGATQLAGTFSARDGVLDAELTTNVTEYSEWSAEIDGQPVPVAASPAEPPPVGPELTEATYSCTADVLTVSPAGGTGPAHYDRV